jgi:Uma2 family endonuclease
MTAFLTEPAPGALPLVGEDDPLFEIIDGRYVALPPGSYFASLIASALFGKLFAYKRTNDCGLLTIETLFRLPLDMNRSRRPDVAFVSYERWPKGQPFNRTDDAWAVVPELAVEVSPTDRAEEVMEKVQEYFQAGVELVWVIYPSLRLWTVYESLASSRTLTVADELDGGTVLPGFRLSLGAFFAGLPAEA